jgi:MFS family permease
LSAAVSSESLEKDDNRLSTLDTTQSLQENPRNNLLWFVTKKPNSLAAVFSLQGLGLLLSSLVILFFLALHFPLESTWRLCLGLGAVPSIIAFYLRWKMHESKTFKNAARRFQHDRDSCTTGDSSESDLSDFKKIATMQSIEDNNPIEKNKIETHSTSPLNMNQQIAASCHHSVELQKSRDPPTQMSCFNTLKYRKHWKKSGKLLYLFRYALLGSCLSWFLIDVTLYGVASYKTDLSKMILESTLTDMKTNGKSLDNAPHIAGSSPQHPGSFKYY